jgi:hypothetical protein
MEDRYQGIAETTAYQLATMADCFTPDSLESAGAVFLTGVRDAAVEAWPRVREAGGTEDRGDVLSEIADDAPDVYDHTRWQEFVDLGAYHEEPEEGEWPKDLTKAAGVALYQIAYRLADAIFTAMQQADDDNAAETSEE